MEFFNRAKAVRLKSHLEKFLVADEDEHTVRQGRNGSSKKACWTVEFVEGSHHLIRLKSCHGGYLTASDHHFLLGMTGNRVIQSLPQNDVKIMSVEWEPIKEGYKVKLRTRGGTYLRANGATPPWRNTVTHDQLPYRTATQDWVLWDVDLVDISVLDEEPGNLQSYPSSISSFSSSQSVSLHSNNISPFHHDSIGYGLRASSVDHWPSYASGRQGGMEFFYRAKAVRLESHLGKYLVADDDEETVRQSQDGASRNARWTVEFVNGKDNVIRLKSCHGQYLTTSEEPFLLGMTGKKVVQTLPSKKTDTSIEWEPIKEGFHVKLRTAEGKYLRANGATPPWRNSVTHDVPNRTATQDWVLWGVDVVDIVVTDGSDSPSSCLSPGTSFNSVVDDYTASADIGTPPLTTRPHNDYIKPTVI